MLINLLNELGQLCPHLGVTQSRSADTGDRAVLSWDIVSSTELSPEPGTEPQHQAGRGDPAGKGSWLGSGEGAAGGRSTGPSSGGVCTGET